MEFKIALAGNPNSGKTTLFNQLTGSQQYVGNWPGVTVEKKEGNIKGFDDIVLVDLPGIYSLSPYTLEEVVSREFLLEEDPNVIINIVDATNIQRNLYLTTQLMELGIPVVIALNMIDIIRKNGDTVDIDTLSKSIGCPVIEISALKNIGTKDVIVSAIALAKDPSGFNPNISYEPQLETALKEIENIIEGAVNPKSIRWYSLKLMERDRDVLKEINLTSDQLSAIDNITKNIESAYDDDSESIITNQRYEYIDHITKDSITHELGKISTSDKIDKIVTSKWLALPIFAAVMFLVYYIAIATVGTGLTDWVNDVLFGEYIPEAVGGFLTSMGASPIVLSLVNDGVIAGVGAVLGFLPQMMTLFFLLAILEDSGYMARIAFIMDKVFRKFGLSGKSFIPMLITTGCGVPGIMASRTIESERDRKMTVMISPFIPCSAKLPIIALITGALFSDAWWIAPSAYFLGVVAVIISGIILKKTKIFEGDTAPFVMELPPYRIPNPKNLVLHMWDKGKSFVKRAGSVIFVSSVLIWFLSNFNFRMQYVDTDVSILASLGNLIAPIFAPLGWGNWRAAVATISGLIAKENVVATFGVLYGFGEVSEAGTEIWATLRQSFTPIAGYSFLMFNMFCAPCFAAIGATKKEIGTKWMWIAITYQTLFAYVVALIIYQIGTYAMTGIFTIGTFVALAAILALVYMLIRPDKRQKKLALKG